MTEGTREDSVLSDAMYLHLRDLLLARAGLHYPERKRADLAYGISMALSAGGHSRPAAFLAEVCAGGPAWETLLAHLTIGETYFFRHSAQFAALREHILPELLERRGAVRNLRIWSAGCATGEEPYSLAILVSELLAGCDPWSVSLLATDINPHFLARARAALYRGWSFRETPDHVRDRYFTREGLGYRLNAAIRRMVHFAQLNLAEPSYPALHTNTTALDIIVCRNVTIYFDEATTRQVAARFYDALAPGGWLVVGHAEPQAATYHQFATVNFPDTVVYRKPLSAPLFVSSGGPSTLAGQAQQPGAAPAPSLAAARPAANQASPPSGQPAAPCRMPPAALGATPARPDLGIAAQVRDARRHADEGRWEQAKHECAAVLERDPLCIPAHYLLGQIHEHELNLTDALAAYRRTTFLDRTFVPGLIGQGNVFRQLGRAADAQRCYRSAITRLRAMDERAEVPGADGVSAGELTTLVQAQLARLP